MTELVIGGSGSGKSAYAEDRICSLWNEKGKQGGLYYIAAMIPYGEETKQKIERHRRMRAGKGFETLEWHTGLAGHLQGNEELIDACVLVECMSNLVANELYDESGAGRQAADEIMEGIRLLKERCAHLVIVTNDVFAEPLNDQEELTFYKACLGEINRRIGAEADRVTEVVCGIPVCVASQDAVGAEKGKKETSHCTAEREEDECGIDCPELEEYECRIGCPEHEEKKCGIVCRELEKKGNGVPCQGQMWFVTGGAFQGKREYAERRCPDIQWVDGTNCDLEEIRTCVGMDRFHLFIRRWIEAGRESAALMDVLQERRSGRERLALIADEIGCGLVPTDAFERRYREEAGRVCAEAAGLSDRVDRVVCGVGVCIKLLKLL